jgi:hypothetical protein
MTMHQDVNETETNGTDDHSGGECSRCDGCGQLADTDRREPWTAWASSPVSGSMPSAHLAVTLGWVKPIPCDVCKGIGRAPGAVVENAHGGLPLGELVNYMAVLPRDTIVCISTPDGLRPVTSIDQQFAVTGLSQTSRVVVLATEVSE